MKCDIFIVSEEFPVCMSNYTNTVNSLWWLGRRDVFVCIHTPLRHSHDRTDKVDAQRTERGCDTAVVQCACRDGADDRECTEASNAYPSCLPERDSLVVGLCKNEE